MPAGHVKGPQFSTPHPQPVWGQGRPCICDSSTPSARWEVEAAETPDDCGPASLACAAEKSKRPCLKQNGRQGPTLEVVSDFHMLRLTHNLQHGSHHLLSASMNLSGCSWSLISKVNNIASFVSYFISHGNRSRCTMYKKAYRA